MNLLKNGDFEEGPYVFSNNSGGVIIPPNVEDDHSPQVRPRLESLLSLLVCANASPARTSRDRHLLRRPATVASSNVHATSAAPSPPPTSTPPPSPPLPRSPAHCISRSRNPERGMGKELSDEQVHECDEHRRRGSRRRRRRPVPPSSSAPTSPSPYASAATASSASATSRSSPPPLRRLPCIESSPESSVHAPAYPTSALVSSAPATVLPLRRPHRLLRRHAHQGVCPTAASRSPEVDLSLTALPSLHRTWAMPRRRSSSTTGAGAGRWGGSSRTGMRRGRRRRGPTTPSSTPSSPSPASPPRWRRSRRLLRRLPPSGRCRLLPLRRQPPATSMRTSPPSSSSTTTTSMDIESAKCECYGLKEDCTQDYITGVKANFDGRWLCGLYAEAVRDEETKGRWSGYGVKKKSPRFRSNPATRVADGMRQMLRRRSGDGGQ